MAIAVNINDEHLIEYSVNRERGPFPGTLCVISDDFEVKCSKIKFL